MGCQWYGIIDNSQNEEPNLCFMENHEENKVTACETKSNLTYDELLAVYEELNDESNKLRKNYFYF